MTRSSTASRCTSQAVGCPMFTSPTPFVLDAGSSVDGFLQVRLPSSLHHLSFIFLSPSPPPLLFRPSSFSICNRKIQNLVSKFSPNFSLFDNFSTTSCSYIQCRGSRPSLATDHEPLCCEKLGSLSREDSKVALRTVAGGF